LPAKIGTPSKAKLKIARYRSHPEIGRNNFVDANNVVKRGGTFQKQRQGEKKRGGPRKCRKGKKMGLCRESSAVAPDKPPSELGIIAGRGSVTSHKKGDN